ncbi:MAG TPA: hypothetical protein PKE26_06115 [Kiritimatiellia bacterium]|nr:hypothetical protein [Kiritimatiellia bacterium]HMP91140.1 hypothetical protein [Kiritimatiellia bacterium]
MPHAGHLRGHFEIKGLAAAALHGRHTINKENTHQFVQENSTTDFTDTTTNQGPHHHAKTLSSFTQEIVAPKNITFVFIRMFFMRYVYTAHCLPSKARVIHLLAASFVQSVVS